MVNCRQIVALFLIWACAITLYKCYVAAISNEMCLIPSGSPFGITNYFLVMAKNSILFLRHTELSDLWECKLCNSWILDFGDI